MFFNPKIPGDAACSIFRLFFFFGNELRTWPLNNLLKLNDFFLSVSPHNITRLSNITIQIGSTEITPSSSINSSQLAKIKKSTFLTCPCHNIHMVESVGLKKIQLYLENYDFCEYMQFGEIL